MVCDHSGFHTFRSEYDRLRGVLVFVRVCERCHASLDEALREKYRPQFDAHGNDRYLTVKLPSVA